MFLIGLKGLSEFSLISSFPTGHLLLRFNQSIMHFLQYKCCLSSLIINLYSFIDIKKAYVKIKSILEHSQDTAKLNILSKSALYLARLCICQYQYTFQQ